MEIQSRPIDSDPPAARAAQELRDSSLMRHVNRNLRRLSETFAHSDPIMFFCECQIPTCYATLRMSAAAFDAAVADRTGWLLHEGHTPSEFWPPSGPAPSPEVTGALSGEPDVMGRGRRPVGSRWSSSIRVRLARGSRSLPQPGRG